uniref:non-specific serine/threonine protein kinase n=1 Tax=Heterorhabditis bacteriophora TaxID=37862 RepID=A0A1I7XIA4_HETBA
MDKIWATCIDIFINALFQPVSFFPLLAITGRGVLITNFGFSTFACLQIPVYIAKSPVWSSYFDSGIVLLPPPVNPTAMDLLEIPNIYYVPYSKMAHILLFCLISMLTLLDGQKVGQWEILRKLGEGGFGAVYLCKNKENQRYALKVEAENDPIGLLKMEVYVLMELKKTNFQGSNKLFCLDLRADSPLKKFSMGTAISVGKQCLEAVEDLHNVGILHRDIKPGNYTVGRKDTNELRKIYMLDFGMARKFIKDDGTLRNPRLHRMLKVLTKLARAGFRGTVKYAPLACHVQREQCRKDDIESWMYMLVEITCGRLPWRNLTDSSEVGMFKKDCKGERYRCLFGGCPREYLGIFPILDKTTVPFLFLFTPFVFLIIRFYDGTLGRQILNNVATMLVSNYGILATLFLIYFNHPYRTFLLEMLRRKDTKSISAFIPIEVRK